MRNRVIDDWRFVCETMAQATPREWGAVDESRYRIGLGFMQAAKAEVLGDLCSELVESSTRFTEQADHVRPDTGAMPVKIDLASVCDLIETHLDQLKKEEYANR